MTDQDSIIAVQDRAHELAVLGRHAEAQKLYAAAERIRVLGEEVELSRKWERSLWRDLEGRVEFRPPHYPGVMRDLTEARAATDAARRGA